MQKSILIVEDDLDQARMLRVYLEKSGFEVSCFLSSSEALENFKLDINYYSIVLADFRLDEMNGTNFAKEIRKMRGNGIIIILMTGYFNDPSLKETEIIDVINKVIVKPFSLEFLNKTIVTYLNHYN